MKRLRVAVVGLDHYHVTGWVESLGYFDDRIEIVGLYDPDPERGRALRPTFSDPHLSAALPASFAALPFYTKLDRLLAEVRPDLALVTLLNHAAPAAVEQLAAAGVHMLVDKPGARTADEARRAFSAAKAAGVRVGVGLGKRHARMWHDFREAAASERFGRLLSGEAIFVTSSVRVRDPRNFLFRRDLSGGGILHWLAIHDLDALTWLTRRRVVEVQALAGTVGGESIDVEDTISATLRLEGGAIVTLHYAYALPRRGNEGYMALRGSGGSLRVTLGGGLEWFGPGDRSDPVASQQTVYTLMDARGYGTAGIYIVGDLLDAIEQGREPLATGADLVRALALIEAIYEAARTGQRMRVAASGD